MSCLIVLTSVFKYVQSRQRQVSAQSLLVDLTWLSEFSLLESWTDRLPCHPRNSSSCHSRCLQSHQSSRHWSFSLETTVSSVTVMDDQLTASRLWVVVNSLETICKITSMYSNRSDLVLALVCQSPEEKLLRVSDGDDMSKTYTSFNIHVLYGNISVIILTNSDLTEKKISWVEFVSILCNTKKVTGSKQISRDTLERICSI